MANEYSRIDKTITSASDIKGALAQVPEDVTAISLRCVHCNSTRFSVQFYKEHPGRLMAVCLDCRMGALYQLGKLTH